MSLAVLAQQMASKGRNGDTMLVHMAPSEVAGLQALGLRHGVSMTINPYTGLPEAFSFKSLLKAALPMIAGFALGPAGFGLVSSSLGAAAVVGGVTGLATGSLQKGIMAGLGAYGGAELGGALVGGSSAGATAAAAEAAKAAGNELAFSNMMAESVGSGAVTGAAADKFVQDAATKAYSDFAAKPFLEQATGSFTALKDAPGMFGGLGALAKPALMAAAPIMADAMVQTATSMPSRGSPYPFRIRPMAFDPYRQTYEQLPIVSAYPSTPTASGQGMNSGGIVALANGGAAQTYFQQNPDVAAAYAARFTDPNLASTRDMTPEAFAQTHFEKFGRFEGRKFGEPAPTPMPEFTDTPGGRYLQANPDVATAYTNRYIDPNLASTIGMTPEQFALTHYEKFGKGEQRAWPAMSPLIPDIPQGQVTYGEAFEPVTPTMGEVRKEYEQGGGHILMPTITDIKPTDRTYTQNEAFGLLQDYLRANPNAQYQDVVGFARTQGIPDMQARAAYNEFRFSGLTGGSKQAYDYLMGRGAYPVSPFVPGGGPIMRPYAEAVGLAPVGSIAGGDFYSGRKTTPTDPERRTTLDTTGTTTGIAGLTAGTTPPPGVNTTTATTPTGPSGSTVLSGDARPADLVATNPNFVDTTQAATVANTLADNTGIDPMDALMIVTNAFGTATNTSDMVGNAATALADKTGMDEMDALMYVTNAFGTGPGVHTGDTEGSITGGLIPALVDRPVGETLAPVEDRSIPYNPTFDYGGNYDAIGKFNQPLDEFGTYGGGGGDDWKFSAFTSNFRKGGLADVAAAAAARGGDVPRFNLGSYSDGGRLLRGPGDGVSDSIPATIGNKQPARLADGEFVVPARIVSEIGNGSTEAGARKLYAMMDRVQRARAKTTGKGKVAKNTRAEKYLPA